MTTSRKSYRDLLAEAESADLGTNMENAAAGRADDVSAGREQAGQPAFPARPLFAAGGLGAGLGLGLLIAIFLEFSDKSIRTERDAAMAMDLPLLISVPWVGPEEETAATATAMGTGGENSGAATPEHSGRRRSESRASYV